MAEVAAFIATTGIEIAGVSIGTGTLLQVAVVVGSALNNKQHAKRSAEAARQHYNANLTDHQLMIRSAIAPRTSCYGRDKVSGPIVFGHVSGTKKEYLHLVIPVNGRRADAIEKVFFNEVELPAPDGSGFITSGDFARAITHTTNESTSSGSLVLGHTPTKIISVSKATGSGDLAVVDVLTSPTGYTISGSTVTFVDGAGPTYTVNFEWQESQPRVRIKKYLGAPGQVADADLIAESGGKWTSDHVGVGIAYIYARLQYDRQVFGQIGLPTIAVGLRGNLVFDPRTSTVAWSDNAALCAADYMRDTLLGMGCSSAQVPDAEVTVAANISDENVNLDATPTTQHRYTCNGTLTSAAGRMDNLETLLLPMAGTAVWVQGRWLLRAGAHRSSEFTLDESWLAKPGPKIVPRAPRGELFNAVKGKFIDPAQAYNEVDFPPVLNSTYEAEDGGRRVFRSVPMTGVNDSMRAQRLAKIALEQSRQALTVTVVCNMRAYDTLPSQVGTLNLARYGWVNKPAEVKRRVLDLQSRTVTLTLRETAAAVWDWAYGEATVFDPAPNTSLPSWSAPPPALTSLAVASGTTHLLKMADGTIVTRGFVTWDAVTEAFVFSGGRIEIGWKLDADAEWQSASPLPGDAVSAYIAPLDDRRVTLVRARAISYSGREGPWAYVTHTVVGKSAVPANVAGLAAVAVPGGALVSWTASTEVDHEETEIRVGASWGAGTTIFRGKAAAFLWSWPALATHTFRAKHRDTSGNESATDSNVSLALTAANTAVPATGVPSIGGGNLISDASFEVDADGNGVADHWNMFANGTTGTVTGSLLTGGVAGGKFQRIVAANLGTASTDQAGLYSVVDLTSLGGKPFVYSAWINGLGGGLGGMNAHLYIDFYNGADPSTSSIVGTAQRLVVTPAVGWQRYELQDTVPATALSARCYVWQESRGVTPGTTNLDLDAVQFEIGAVPTQFAPRAGEILYGQVITSMLALASATSALAATGSVSTDDAPSSTVPFDITANGPSLSYVNDTGGTIVVQVELTVTNAFTYETSELDISKLQIAQTGAVGGSTTESFADFDGVTTDSPITGANPITRVYTFSIASGSTLTCTVQARCAADSGSGIGQLTADGCLLRLTAIKR